MAENDVFLFMFPRKMQRGLIPGSCMENLLPLPFTVSCFQVFYASIRDQDEPEKPPLLCTQVFPVWAVSQF